MGDFASVFDEAGDSAEQAQAARAMGVAKQASTGIKGFLFQATGEDDFGHRIAMAETELEQAAAAGGISVHALVADITGEFDLLMEAKRSTAASGDNHTTCPNHEDQSYNKSTGDCSCGSNHKRWAGPNNPGGMKTSAAKPVPCTTCNGARSIPAQGHESYHEVHNGQVRCPGCAGHGVQQADGELDTDDRTAYERFGDTGAAYSDAGDEQDRHYGEDYLDHDPHFSSRIASIRTALQEGQDPLAWLEGQGGEGQAEKPSEAGIEASPDAAPEEATRPF